MRSNGTESIGSRPTVPSLVAPCQGWSERGIRGPDRAVGQDVHSGVRLGMAAGGVRSSWMGADGGLVQMPVEGAAIDLEDVDDLLDRVLALVVEALRGGDLREGELGRRPP